MRHFLSLPPRRAALCLALLLLPATLSAAVPSFAQAKAAYRPSEAIWLDRHGQPLQSARVDRSVRRLAWTPLSAISPALQAAVIASEDQRFLQHQGVD